MSQNDIGPYSLRQHLKRKHINVCNGGSKINLILN